MNVVKVNVSELLEILKTNRSKHRELFEKALVNFKKIVISELEEMLEAAKANKEVRTIINIQRPSDQTKDYDTAIKMLEMSVDEEVKITNEEFTNFVLDEWHWTRQNLATNSAYASWSGNVGDKSWQNI